MSSFWKYAMKLNGVKVQCVRRGAYMGHTYLDLCGQQRTSAWESLLTVILSDISPKSAAWGGSRKMRREESTELAAFARFPFLCLCQSWKRKGAKDFPVLPLLQQGSRTKQNDFWFTHVLLFPLSETHSLWVLAGFLCVIWSCFLQVFSMIFLVLYVQPVMCKFSVQTK